MKKSTIQSLFIFLISCMILIGCTESTINTQSINEDDNYRVANAEAFEKLMQKHLDAVTNRDLVSLKSTLAPDGKMQLILPATEIIVSVDSFMTFHEAWFQDTIWDFKTTILNTEVSDDMGMAIVESYYSEPERDGGPYFNRMIISYTLKKYDEKWYVIKDHATSAEKSTDKK